MAEIKLDLNMDPVERLTKEIEVETDSISIRIGQFLLEKFASDESLKNAYLERKVTLADVSKYVYTRAEDKAKDSSNSSAIAISDEEVFGWVIHFVQDGEDKDVEALRTGANSITLTKEEEADLRAKAMEEFKQKELERLEEERLAKERAEKEATEKAEKARLKKIEEEERKRKESGQISLFDDFNEE